MEWPRARRQLFFPQCPVYPNSTMDKKAVAKLKASEVKELARAMGIPGRSKMSTDERRAAILAAGRRASRQAGGVNWPFCGLKGCSKNKVGPDEDDEEVGVKNEFATIIEQTEQLSTTYDSYNNASELGVKQALIVSMTGIVSGLHQALREKANTSNIGPIIYHLKTIRDIARSVALVLTVSPYMQLGAEAALRYARIMKDAVRAINKLLKPMDDALKAELEAEAAALLNEHNGGGKKRAKTSKTGRRI